MGNLGTNVVVRKHGLRWSWHYMTGDVEVSHGISETKKRALADAQASATVWLTDAWRMIQPGATMTQEQRILCKKFGVKTEKPEGR